jgi:hypothetical protein
MWGGSLIVRIECSSKKDRDQCRCQDRGPLEAKTQARGTTHFCVVPGTRARQLVPQWQSCSGRRLVASLTNEPSSGSEYRYASLRAAILRLQVIQIGGFILALVIVLRHATNVARASNRRGSKRSATAYSIALRKRHVDAASAIIDNTASVSGTVTSILRDD